MAPMAAILAATREAATLIKRLDQIGTLEPGKLADLIVVDGSPIDDVTRLRHGIQMVVQAGVVRRDDLGLAAASQRRERVARPCRSSRLILELATRVRQGVSGLELQLIREQRRGGWFQPDIVDAGRSTRCGLGPAERQWAARTLRPGQRWRTALPPPCHHSARMAVRYVAQCLLRERC